ncbi:hypothetical protein [Thiohalospira halophila]|uniref:hypothetical protein n=1 Tax=Thiohalospira halophila TaxID=381300 RepID=UPI00117CE6C5|nr:hypothetical protein [Thiohalospira halophila]
MIEVFQFVFDRLSGSKLPWFAEISVVIIFFMSTVAISASSFYSRPVQQLWSDVKRLVATVTAKAKEANKSPYDRKTKDNRVMAWFMIGWFYLMMVVMFVYGLQFSLIFSGVFGPEELPFYKRVVSLGVAVGSRVIPWLSMK